MNRRWLFAFVAVLVATVGQLAIATFVGGLPQFEGKAFGARLLAYPVLMMVPVVLWWLVARRRADPGPVPWAGFTFIALPFLIDVTGNTFDLYDSVVWWDDANHFVNWLLLNLGIGLVVVRPGMGPPWVVVTLVTGIGAILAIGWELGEWYTFIRHGTELDVAYTDTLGDEALGTLGAFTAGLLVLRLRRDAPRSSSPADGEDVADVTPSV